jgi:hypothetical protein
MTAPKRYAIEEFLGTTNYAGASFSSDNRTLLTRCATYRFPDLSPN